MHISQTPALRHRPCKSGYIYYIYIYIYMYMYIWIHAHTINVPVSAHMDMCKYLHMCKSLDIYYV